MSSFAPHTQGSAPRYTPSGQSLQAYPELLATSPISPGAFNPAHLGLVRSPQPGEIGEDSVGSNGSNGIGSNASSYGAVHPSSVGSNSSAGSSSRNASASPTSPLVRPSVINKPAEHPLPSFVYVPSNLRYLLVGFVQIFLIWLLYTFTAYQIGVPWQVFLKIRHINSQTTQEDISTTQAFLLFLWIMPAYAILFPLSLLCTIVVKWVLIGRYKEGKHKLWGFYYLRWWFVQRITGLVPLVYLRGTVLMNLYARAMGMKVGRNAFLNSFNFEAWDLIEIGEDASIGCDCHLSNFSVENGYLTITKIVIGKRSYVGTRSIVQGSMESDAHLGAMSLLSHGKTIKANEAWRGSPAKKVGSVDNIYSQTEEPFEDDEVFEDEEKNAGDKGAAKRGRFKPVPGGANSLSQELIAPGAPGSSASADALPTMDGTRRIHRFGRPSACRLFLLGLWQFWFLCGVLSAIILISASPGLIAIHYIMSLPNSDLFPELDIQNVWWTYLAAVPCMAISFVLAFCLQVTVLKNIIMRSIEPGHYWIYSWWYLRKWMVDVLLQLSLHTVYTMYATMYLPPWLRTMGAKLGKGTEISTAADYSPDLLEIGEGCFVADSVYLGVPTVYMGQVRMERITVGSKTFLGNGACLSLDSNIGSNALLGVMSTPPPVKRSKEEMKRPVTWPEGPTEIATGTNYLGSPPMLLPNRQAAQGTFDTASTFNPTTWLYAQRLTFEFFRITLPFMFITALMLMYMGNFEYILFQEDQTYADLALFWMVTWPAIYVGAAFICCFIVLLFKWILVGKYVPSEAPLWSNFVWRTELCVGLMEALANPFFINHIRSGREDTAKNGDTGLGLRTGDKKGDIG